MELAIVSHFFPYTFENLSKCALSKTLLLKGRKDTDRKKNKKYLPVLKHIFRNSPLHKHMQIIRGVLAVESSWEGKEATVSET